MKEQLQMKEKTLNEQIELNKKYKEENDNLIKLKSDSDKNKDDKLQEKEIELNKQKENNVQLNLTIKNLENELNNLKQSKSNENTFKQDEYEKILEEKDINISQLNKSNSELNDKIVKIENEINSQKNIINEYEQNKVKLIEEKKSLIENNENLKIELNQIIFIYNKNISFIKVIFIYCQYNLYKKYNKFKIYNKNFLHPFYNYDK